LSTSLAIVKNHRGFMSLETAAKAGRTFHVHLPVAEAAAAGAPAFAFADAPAGRGELVLLVDDEEMIIDLARETLEGQRLSRPVRAQRQAGARSAGGLRARRRRGRHRPVDAVMDGLA
jgi:hypothetical protein